MFSRNLFCIYLISTILFVLLSCTQKEVNNAENGELIEISHSSGDDYSYSKGEENIFYAPYPFNQGVLEGKDDRAYDVVILSKHIAKGKSIGIEIFAKMTIVNFAGKETEILVAKPTNKKYEIAAIKDFYDFSVEQFYFKQMVQYWYSNRYGLNGTIVKGWEPASIEVYKD